MKLCGFCGIHIVRCQINATPKPIGPIAQSEVTDVHVDDGNMWVVGVQDHAYPSRPESLGCGVHLSLQGWGRLPFHLTEIDTASLPHFARSQYACPSPAAARPLPRILDKRMASLRRFEFLNSCTNAVLKIPEIFSKMFLLFLIHGRGDGALAIGYSSGNKCW